MEILNLGRKFVPKVILSRIRGDSGNTGSIKERWKSGRTSEGIETH